MIYYITEDVRSSKSGFAQERALSLSDNPIYTATARIGDNDFEKRVERHRRERDERWDRIEEEVNIGSLDISGRVAVLDCVTLWLTNLYLDLDNDVEACLEKGKMEFSNFIKQEATFIVISNEIGMGVHAQTKVGRKFTELQGWMNQFIAAKADKATFMVSGLPLTLK